jgi:hypothetical protein
MRHGNLEIRGFYLCAECKRMVARQWNVVFKAVVRRPCHETEKEVRYMINSYSYIVRIPISDLARTSVRINIMAGQCMIPTYLAI